MWIDGRLQYQNLDANVYKNEIPHDIALEIWKPELVFRNHKEEDSGKQMLAYNAVTSALMIKKKDNGKESPFSQLDEARIYNSSETEIMMRSFHYLKFTCEFDLQYFPFDQQTCFVKVNECIVLS